MATFGNLRDQFYSLVADASSSGVFSIAEVDRWLNEGLDRIQFDYEWQFLERGDTSSITTTTSTHLYDLPSDFRKIVDNTVIYVDDTTSTNPLLSYITPEEYARRNTTVTASTPQEYFIQYKSDGYSRQLGLYPQPDEAKAVHFRYLRLMSALTQSSQVPQFPTQWHHLIPYYGAARAFEKVGEADFANDMRIKFAQGLGEMRGEYKHQRSNVLPSFKQESEVRDDVKITKTQADIINYW